jgi:hypothetical protein
MTMGFAPAAGGGACLGVDVLGLMTPCTSDIGSTSVAQRVGVGGGWALGDGPVASLTALVGGFVGGSATAVDADAVASFFSRIAASICC